MSDNDVSRITEELYRAAFNVGISYAVAVLRPAIERGDVTLAQALCAELIEETKGH